MTLKSLIVSLSLLLGPVFGFSQAAPITVTDSQGQDFSIPRPATRIVSLAPHLTELMFAVGAGDRVVGTVEHSDYPKKAQEIRRVGNHQALDMEAIVALRPDLVLAWSGGNSAASLIRIEAMQIPVYRSNPTRLGHIGVLLRDLARLTDVDARGEEVATHFERLLNELRQQNSRNTGLKVFFQIWDRPLMTINGQHYINDVIELCGGENIFAEEKLAAPSVSREAVIKRNPDVILVNGMGPLYQAWLQDWSKWRHISAVARGHLFEIKAHTIAQPTPRILMGVRRVCQVLQSAGHSASSDK